MTGAVAGAGLRRERQAAITASGVGTKGAAVRRLSGAVVWYGFLDDSSTRSALGTAETAFGAGTNGVRGYQTRRHDRVTARWPGLLRAARRCDRHRRERPRRRRLLPSLTSPWLSAGCGGDRRTFTRDLDDFIL